MASERVSLIFLLEFVGYPGDGSSDWKALDPIGSGRVLKLRCLVQLHCQIAMQTFVVGVVLSCV